MRPRQMKDDHSGGLVCCLSDYWRIDRSQDRSRELASVLGGAAAQAELMQRRLRRTGANRYPRPRAPVILDPKLLNGFAAPIPGVVVDCVVGLAVREAAMRELSEPGSKWSGWGDLDEESRKEFTRLHQALEEMYVSRRIRRLSPTLCEYVRTMRRTLMPWRRPVWSHAPNLTPSRSMIVHLWVGWKLYGERPTTRWGEELRHAVKAFDERAGRCLGDIDGLRRVECAGDLWEWLRGFPRDPSWDDTWWHDEAAEGFLEIGSPEMQRQLRMNAQGGADPGGLIDLTSADTSGQAGLHEETFDEEAGATEGVEFVTAQLREMGVRSAVTAIRNARYDPFEHERALRETAREIESVRHLFSRLEESRARWRHGLRRGKLDGRALTKAAAGKDRVFKRRDLRGGCSLALVFLIDVSASMRSHMPTVNRAACVVSEALQPLAPRVWFEVLTYTSAGLDQGSPVQLTRLAASGTPLSLCDVWMEGGTPSGEAIAAAMLCLGRRTASRKLVLHFTDGHPKNTYLVRQALEVGRRMGVDVLTISVGTPQESLYGEGKCEVAYAVAELPQVLARLLPRLYG